VSRLFHSVIANFDSKKTSKDRPDMNDQSNPIDDLGTLMFRVAMRDQAAFKQLYDATVRCLLAIVERMLRDRAWAEDVVQEVYVSIWNTAPNYSAMRALPMTWLMTIARNKAMDALRSTNAERQHIARPAINDDDDYVADIADDRCGLLEQLERGAEAAGVRKCMQGLEGAQRQAISLAFYDGLTHAELALHLHQPLGTVKAWVRRGLDRLKRCLERSDVQMQTTT
jgi:RNA polymerase sigma-70 factor, ECF subfamily